MCWMSVPPPPRRLAAPPRRRPDRVPWRAGTYADGATRGALEAIQADGRFPVRVPRGEDWPVGCEWSRLPHALVLDVRETPASAGANFFGRYPPRRTVDPDG